MLPARPSDRKAARISHEPRTVSKSGARAWPATVSATRSAHHGRIEPTDFHRHRDLRSYLPSGWGIRPNGAGAWDAAKSTYQIEVYDWTDNLWPLKVTGKEAAAHGRLEALKASVDKLYRKALR